MTPETVLRVCCVCSVIAGCSVLPGVDGQSAGAEAEPHDAADGSPEGVKVALFRPHEVAESYRLRVRVDARAKVKARGRELARDHHYLHLDATARVAKVHAGQPELVHYNIRSLDFADEQGRVQATELPATAEGVQQRKVSSTATLHPRVLTAFEDALDKPIALGLGDQRDLGSTKRRKVGESWAVSVATIVKDLEKNGVFLGPPNATMQLVAVVPCGPVACHLFKLRWKAPVLRVDDIKATSGFYTEDMLLWLAEDVRYRGTHIKTSGSMNASLSVPGGIMRQNVEFEGLIETLYANEPMVFDGQKVAASDGEAREGSADAHQPAFTTPQKNGQCRQGEALVSGVCVHGSVHRLGPARYSDALDAYRRGAVPPRVGALTVEQP